MCSFQMPSSDDDIVLQSPLQFLTSSMLVAARVVPPAQHDPPLSRPSEPRAARQAPQVRVCMSVRVRARVKSYYSTAYIVVSLGSRHPSSQPFERHRLLHRALRLPLDDHKLRAREELHRGAYELGEGRRRRRGLRLRRLAPRDHVHDDAPPRCGSHPPLPSEA